MWQKLGKGSLYQSRIYVITNNGSKYLYNKGSNWDDPIDNDIKVKLTKYGYNIYDFSDDDMKSYMFLDFQKAYYLGNNDVDYTKIKKGDQFTISSTFLTPNQVITIDDGVSNSTHIFDLVNGLNNLLKVRNINEYYNFFVFDIDKIGFKVNSKFADNSNHTNLAISDTNGTSISNGLKITGSIITSSSKAKNDYETAITNYINGTNDLALKVKISDQSQGDGYFFTTLKNNNIAEISIEIRQIPETFRIRY